MKDFWEWNGIGYGLNTFRVILYIRHFLCHRIELMTLFFMIY
jgi:hypothetical protein